MPTKMQIIMITYAVVLGHSTWAEKLLIDEFLNPENYDKHTCEVLLEQYANATSSFTFCAVKNARPIRICERCVVQYGTVIDAHEEILKIEDEKGHKMCKENLMNLDRLEVIEDGFEYINNLWNRANCEYCFEEQQNGTSRHLSNLTSNFLTLLNVTANCIAKHALVNNTYNTSVCIDCEIMYCDLNHFYDNLKDAQSGVCMDIIDLMNITRALWSETLSCVKNNFKLDLTLILSTSFVGFLPILFYLSAWIFTTEVRNRLQMQKRLAQLLPSTSAET